MNTIDSCAKFGDYRRLYGGLRDLVGTPIYQVPGRGNFDGFQHLLSVPTISHLLNDQTGLWQQLMTGAQSVVGQTVGKLEAAEQRGQLTLSPEVVAHWEWLIAPLENARRTTVSLWTSATGRRSFLGRLLKRLESSFLYRIIAVVATVGTAVIVIAGLVIFLR